MTTKRLCENKSINCEEVYEPSPFVCLEDCKNSKRFSELKFSQPCIANSGQSLASNGPVVLSRDLTLVFGHTEATHNKLFLSCPTKYTVEHSWPLVMSPSVYEMGRFHSVWPRLRRWKFGTACFLVLIGVHPNIELPFESNFVQMV
ncbi:hypothetical protein TNCV_1766711 [Trichonephila clavipes]|nr:hypothetical protein TNCV_1766711 [Trichonephila clavipes]